jgi:hypothetical protein
LFWTGLTSVGAFFLSFWHLLLGLIPAASPKAAPAIPAPPAAPAVELVPGPPVVMIKTDEKLVGGKVIGRIWCEAIKDMLWLYK